MPHVREGLTSGKKHPLSHAIQDIEKRVESSNAERLALATELREVISQAEALLAALGETAAAARRHPRARGSGRRKGASRE